MQCRTTASVAVDNRFHSVCRVLVFTLQSMVRVVAFFVHPRHQFAPIGFVVCYQDSGRRRVQQPNVKRPGFRNIRGYNAQSLSSTTQVEADGAERSARFKAQMPKCWTTKNSKAHWRASHADQKIDERFHPRKGSCTTRGSRDGCVPMILRAVVTKSSISHPF